MSCCTLGLLLLLSRPRSGQRQKDRQTSRESRGSNGLNSNPSGQRESPSHHIGVLLESGKERGGPYLKLLTLVSINSHSCRENGKWCRGGQSFAEHVMEHGSFSIHRVSSPKRT
uniref:Secreted protein n=1 Tax=Arundo donax TaxID=35708 RepID=A0A0A9FDM8_ARUDO